MSEPTLAKMAVSLDDTSGTVLDYLRRLPEVGQSVTAIADEEVEVLSRLRPLLERLRAVRLRGHKAAVEMWSEKEILAAARAN